MATVLHILDEQGNVELLQSEHLHLYPHIDVERDRERLIELTEEQESELATLNGIINYVGGKLITAPEDAQAVFLSAKSAKLTEINRTAQAFVNELAKLDETPDFERETWSIQREEAKAWFADKTVETPTLATIAQVRGVSLDLLRQKAYEKAIAYQTVAAIVAGQRQAYEDRLNAAETLEQVQAIEAVYSLPQTEAVNDE